MADENEQDQQPPEDAQGNASEEAGAAEIPVGFQAVINPGPGTPDEQADPPPGEDEIAQAMEVLARAGLVSNADAVTGQPMTELVPQLADPNLSDEDRRALLFTVNNQRAAGPAGIAGASRSMLDAQQRQRDEMASSKAEADMWREKMAAEQGDSKPTYLIPHNELRAMRAAEAQAQAIANRQDVTIPGGKFLVNGETVNCNGDLIDDDGNVLQVRSSAPMPVVFVRR
jgi:hypothetical protein